MQSAFGDDDLQAFIDNSDLIISNQDEGAGPEADNNNNNNNNNNNSLNRNRRRSK